MGLPPKKAVGDCGSGHQEGQKNPVENASVNLPFFARFDPVPEWP